MKILTSLISLVVVSLLPPPVAPSAQDTGSGQMYLPYGLPIPPGVEISEPPQPFNKVAHGQPIRNSIPGANMAGRLDVSLPKRHHTVAVDESNTPTFEPGSGDRGLWLTAGEGIYARNDARLTLSIPDAAVGTTLYAPTHMSPGNSCVETVTAHWRYEGMNSTAHGHGFWDWCESDGTGSWQVFEFMDADWTNRYVRRLEGQLRYWTQVYSDSPLSWKGMLYNFNEGRWEEKTTISGSSLSGPTGWTMWESHYLMDVAQVCPQFPDIQASDLQLYINGSWTRLSASNSDDTLGPYGRCWLDGTYTFRLSKKRDMWLARTSK
jgi:hypothetical protein